MRRVLLINPNTTTSATAMMLSIARAALPAGFRLDGATASHGVPMIVSEAELAAAGPEVLSTWLAAEKGYAGVIVAAFGDPGIDLLRANADVPVVGICEAAMLEASKGGRRFGVATVTPQLARVITARAAALALNGRYTGTRLTRGDPRALASDPVRLENALSEAVWQCIEIDGAEAVIVGGGPLSQAAISLSSRFAVPVVTPVAAAARLLAGQLADSP